MVDRRQGCLDDLDAAAARRIQIVHPGPYGTHTTELVACGVRRGRDLRALAFRLALQRIWERWSRIGKEPPHHHRAQARAAAE